MKLSVKKYLQISIYWIGFFSVYSVLILACVLLLEDTTKYILAMVIGILAIGALILGVYNFVNFISMRKKCESYIPEEGIIFNWEANWNRPYASVIVKVGENEYSTSPYFFCEECRKMVGKHVKYAIINDVLFLYEILDD